MDGLPKPLKLSPIEDARVRFYLDHQPTIETWAKLRAEVNDALHDLFLDLAGVLADDAQAIAYADIDVWADTGDSHRARVAIARRSWVDSTGRAPAMIAVEWRKPPLDSTGDLHLYVGIRVGERGRRNRDVAAHLNGLAPALRQELGGAWKREHEAFPVWRWIIPSGPGIDELALAQQARVAAWQCWRAAVSHIDALLTTEA